MAEVRARRAIFNCARHRILVVDQSKIGRPAPHSHGKLWDAETIVCGGALSDGLAAELSTANAQVIRV